MVSLKILPNGLMFNFNLLKFEKYVRLTHSLIIQKKRGRISCSMSFGRVQNTDINSDRQIKP